jgi:hypothetical protein
MVPANLVGEHHPNGALHFLEVKVIYLLDLIKA